MALVTKHSFNMPAAAAFNAAAAAVLRDVCRTT
jgi:hypothetical protein